MKVVAIDYGQKRVGMAVSDTKGRLVVALPLYIWKNDGQDVGRLVEIIRDQEAGQIVVGLPLNMDGSEGSAAENVRAFADEVKTASELPVEFVDERLTSEEAEQRLRDLPMTRAQKRDHINTVAAQIILETYLNQ